MVWWNKLPSERDPGGYYQVDLVVKELRRRHIDAFGFVTTCIMMGCDYLKKMTLFRGIGNPKIWDACVDYLSTRGLGLKNLNQPPALPTSSLFRDLIASVYEQHLGLLRDRSSKGLKRATMDRCDMDPPSKKVMDQAYERYRWIVNYWLRFDIGDNKHDGFIEPRSVDVTKSTKKRRREKTPSDVDAEIDWDNLLQ